MRLIVKAAWRVFMLGNLLRNDEIWGIWGFGMLLVGHVLDDTVYSLEGFPMRKLSPLIRWKPTVYLASANDDLGWE